uniref:Delta(3,5)-Delta(2,4)-dienoyl-CoA isomerase, mitochondrial n=1 Tax=Rhabditophanes sp. KR3021 TaxID=114890 RepID=A0AC35U427_9BILA
MLSLIKNRVTLLGSVKRLCSSNLHFEPAMPQLKDIKLNQIDKAVFNVELNRPNQRNAFTMDLWRELKAVIDYLAYHPPCRSIVLSAAGKSFTAGIDLKEAFSKLTALTQDDSIDIARRSRKIMILISQMQDCFTALEKCPKPIVSAIHSHCIGAGIDLILASDIRYASKDSVFSIKEVDVGMTADVGTLNRIQKVVANDSLTRELAYTGRNFYADEALSYGLVSRLFDTPDQCKQAAIETAILISQKSPIAVQGTKVVLNHARNHSIEDSLEFIKYWNASQLITEDIVKANMGSKEKGSQFSDV